MNMENIRLYNDLAWLWPLWGDAGDYTAYSDHVTGLIRQHSRISAQSLLNLGCGGGKNAYNLKKHFEVTGVDISPSMLELAKKLNPDCEFVLCDMRTCDLHRQFDSVLIDDAISYMTTQSDLAMVFRNAFRHLRPGGVMVVGPDEVKDTFHQNRTEVAVAQGTDKPDNIDVVFIDYSYDPDPDDSTYEGTTIYLIREDGKLRIEHDSHILGLFTLNTWRTTLREAGFEIHESVYTEDSHDYTTFACIRPT